MKISPEEQDQFENADKCWVCGDPFVDAKLCEKATRFETTAISQASTEVQLTTSAT